jgi:hypothetical protein
VWKNLLKTGSNSRICSGIQKVSRWRKLTDHGKEKNRKEKDKKKKTKTGANGMEGGDKEGEGKGCI